MSAESGVVTTIYVPAGETALEATFDRVPTAEFIVASTASTDTATAALWASNADFDDIDTALASDPSVTVRSTLTRTKKERLYHIQFNDEMKKFLAILLAHDGLIFDMSCKDRTWDFRIIYGDRTALSAAHEDLSHHGYNITVNTILNIDEKHSPSGLTTKQQDALEVAYQEGYFTIPRETTLKGLADEFDISYQSLSERLRRAYIALIEAELVRDDDEQDGENSDSEQIS